MTDRSADPPTADLERALIELGHHLDPVDVRDDVAPAFADGVLARLDHDRNGTDAPAARSASVTPRRWRTRALVGIAAAGVAIVIVLAVPPAREAVARWFGIGAVQITRTEEPPAVPAATTTVPGAVPPGTVDLVAIERSVGFEPRLADPAIAGPLLDARVDAAVPSGLVELRYRDVTLVEVAGRVDDGAVLAKTVGPDTTITPVDVAGAPGLWLAGAPHTVAIVGPDGRPVFDAVRRAGDVLLWARDGITIRLEGAASLDRALAVATSTG